MKSNTIEIRNTHLNFSGAIARVYKSVLLASLLLVAAGSMAESLIIPQGTETRENSRSLAEPFSTAGNIRSQQIYSPSLFPVLPAPGQMFQLDGIAFRLSSQGSFGFESGASFDRVEILISSGNGPFTGPIEQNHGGNLQVVYDRPTTLQGNVPSGTTPSNFDLQIPFTQPFLYDPSGGALIVEVRKYGFNSIPGVLGAAEIPGVFYYYGTIDGSFTGTSVRGLETSFTYQVVPEPSTICLMILSFLLLFFGRKRF